jgi:rhodanese-related sulfurtransferase
MNPPAAAVVVSPRHRSAFVQDALAVFIMLAIACGAGALLMHYRQATRPKHPRITLAQMREHVEIRDALILDARDRSAFAISHIPTALNLPLAEGQLRPAMMKTLLRQQRDRLVIVYCADQWCGQADDLQQALIDLGQTRVGLFPGGLDAWLGAGLPVFRSQ